MPKKSKLVTCPRCHRNTKAHELQAHLVTHRGKKPVSIFRPAITKTNHANMKYPKFQEFRHPPAFGIEAFEKYAASKSVKSNLSESQICEKFEGSLKDVNAQYSSLKIEQTREPGVTEVWIDEERNLVLRYNQLSVGWLTEKGIDGLLLHEACHVSTLPNTLLRVRDLGDPDMERFLGNSITNYDEYLAHVEFVRLFRNDPRYEGLKEMHIGLFTNYEIIINAMKIMSTRFHGDSQNFQFEVLENISTIFYDSVFFMVAKDCSFENWCKSHSVNELATFTKWLYDDFEHIRSLNLSIKESHDKVMASAVLSMSINPVNVMLFDQIEFADTTKKLHQDWTQKGHDLDLVQLWEERRLHYQQA
jgi:hypothetical protein